MAIFMNGRHDDSDNDRPSDEETGLYHDMLSAKTPNRFASCLEAMVSAAMRLTRLGHKSPQTLDPTAYLNGLRGFAALMVYCHHHETWFHDNLPHDRKVMESAFGFHAEHYFCTLPLARLFFTGGPFAVALFFVISGYVLSLGPLRAIHAADAARLADALGSALFRRWLRLYIPAAGVSLAFLSLWYVPASPLRELSLMGAWPAELRAWWAEFASFSYVFQRKSGGWQFTYGAYMWTIPFEFQSSVVTYTAMLAFSRCSRDARLAGQGVLLFYFTVVVDGWNHAMFTTGSILCDLDMLAESGNLPGFLENARAHSKACFYTLLAVAVYFGGIPNEINAKDLRENPGWYYLSFIKAPAMRNIGSWYLLLGATLMVACVSHIPTLKRFFETRLCQYLGRISYGMYLIHGPVLWTLGDAIYKTMKPELRVERVDEDWLTAEQGPRSGPLGLEPELLLPQVILMPLTFFVAEVTTRCLDEPSVRFSRWLYKQFIGYGGGQISRRPV